MMRICKRTVSKYSCLTLGFVLCLSASAPAEEPVDFAKFINHHAPSIVTVKFVIKVNTGMGEQETESEVSGVIVDPIGLVLVANTQLSGPMGMIKRFMPPGMNMSSEPSDMKVILGADDEEFDAKILARDTDLDIAWVQIENDENKKFPALDTESLPKLALGQKLMCVRRTGKLYNRAAVLRWGRICGQTDSPRRLFFGSADLATAVGLPLLTPTGRFAGFVVMQMPDEEEAEAFDPMSVIGSMSSIMDLFSGVILPAKQVTRATNRVLETYVKQPIDK